MNIVDNIEKIQHVWRKSSVVLLPVKLSKSNYYYFFKFEI